jgi:hypothetical protein
MNFTIVFTEEQLNFILNLIAERPFKEVHELVNSIRQQGQQQVQAAQSAQAVQPQPEVVEIQEATATKSKK